MDSCCLREFEESLRKRGVRFAPRRLRGWNANPGARELFRLLRDGLECKEWFIRKGLEIRMASIALAAGLGISGIGIGGCCDCGEARKSAANEQSALAEQAARPSISGEPEFSWIRRGCSMPILSKS